MIDQLVLGYFIAACIVLFFNLLFRHFMLCVLTFFLFLLICSQGTKAAETGAPRVCTITQGIGILSISGEVIKSPRYEGATITITDDDIIVDGYFDKHYSYKEKGVSVTFTRDHDWLRIVTPYETIALRDNGALLWAQVSIAPELQAASASVFQGACK